MTAYSLEWNLVIRRGVCRREVLTIGLKTGKRDKYCGAALLPWNLSQGSCSCHSETEKRAKGMQRQNIAVNRLCTGDGSTEAE